MTVAFEFVFFNSSPFPYSFAAFASVGEGGRREGIFVQANHGGDEIFQGFFPLSPCAGPNHPSTSAWNVQPPTYVAQPFFCPLSSLCIDISRHHPRRLLFSILPSTDGASAQGHAKRGYGRQEGRQKGKCWQELKVVLSRAMKEALPWSVYSSQGLLLEGRWQEHVHNICNH